MNVSARTVDMADSRPFDFDEVRSDFATGAVRAQGPERRVVDDERHDSDARDHEPTYLDDDFDDEYEDQNQIEAEPRRSPRRQNHADSEELLQRVIDVVASARSLPLSASVSINRDEVLELL